MKFSLVLAAVLAFFQGVAADWPQWRGPNRNGISAEKVNAHWPIEGPRVLWRASAGFGFSSVSVSRGRAFTMGNSDNRETVFCFDAVSGKPVWKHSYPSKLGAVYHEGGPVSTPTVQGDHVYTISKWGDVFCFNGCNRSHISFNDFWVKPEPV